MNNFKAREINQQWGIIKHQAPLSTPNRDIKSFAIFSSLLDNFLTDFHCTKCFFRYFCASATIAVSELWNEERRGLQIKNASQWSTKLRHEKSLFEINRFMIGFCSCVLSISRVERQPAEKKLVSPQNLMQLFN